MYGPLTGADLTDVTPLLQPMRQDPFGSLRPALSKQALRLSAELSAATYRMAVESWMEAGWQDVTIQMDGELTALIPSEGWLATEVKKQRVRLQLRHQDPVSQVLGALRQRRSSDTGKALVMIRPADNGRHVVAVSFMGTGKRFYDWFSNFRVSAPDGFHKGFSQLTSQFEANEKQIEFPETAKALGVERLTLAHILEEMRSPDSRFFLWLSGHSQGGAVMQVYAHRKLMQGGVHPANIAGYGFASPSVASQGAAAVPGAYPLYHVHNSDDLIPRCGLAVHLGVCLTYPSDEDMRRRCYGWPRDSASVEARLAVRPVIRRMTDTPSCILQALTYLTLLRERRAGEIMAMLGLDGGIGKLLSSRDVDDLMGLIIRRVSSAYRSITGHMPDRAELAESEMHMQRIINQVGLKAFTEALRQLLRQPHHITARQAGFMSAYAYIVREGLDTMPPSVWQNDGDVRRVRAKPMPLCE